MLLLLFAKTSTLIFFFSTHKLIHKLVSLGSCLIVDFLTLFNDLGAFLVATLIADGQRRVSRIVSIKDIDSSVLDHV